MAYNTGSKNQKSQQTKQQIINTFFRLMTNRIWDKITIKELCEEASITRGTFYLYYSDIYNLMEEIQSYLLNDLLERYNQIHPVPARNFSYSQFLTEFDCSAPEFLHIWFEFCQDNASAILALTHPEYGDSYFCNKLKNKLFNYINEMMNNDHMPQDNYRSHFLSLFQDMLLLVARTWLSSNEEQFLSIDGAIQILNSLRVGANYIAYKQNTDADFSKKQIDRI